MRLVKSACLAFAAAALGLGVPTVSKADTYSFLSAGTEVATATTTDAGGGASQVTLHITAPNWFFIQAGQPPMIDWNTSATVNPTLGTSPTQNPGGPVVWALNGPDNPGGGLGSFTDSLGFLPTSNVIWNTDIVFTLNGITLAQFLANADGYFFGVDFCNVAGGVAGQKGCNVGTTVGFTGFLGAVATPLPPAILLFFSALVGMGLLGRRRRKQALAV